MKRSLLFIAIITGLLFACKKNDSGGNPVITGVRTVTPAQKDSMFIQGMPGDLIVIQGHGFSGLKAVYFNDTSAYFNPSYATNNNIILNIPSYAQTLATNPKASNTIRVVTSHGTGIYNFKLILDSPSISSISIDNSGTLLYINGTNLIGVQKITFPVPGNDTALSYTVDTSHRLITAVIPPGTPFSDSVRVYCTFGIATFPYPPPTTVTSISNENAIAGDTITITGTNFIGITKVLFPGNIAGTDLQTVNVNQLTVVVPAGITAPDSLRLVGALGSSAAPQVFDTYLTHPSPGYLSTFDNQNNSDNTGFVGWTGGYTGTPGATYPNATGAVAFLLPGSAMGGNTNPGSQGNPGFIQLNDVPWVSNTATPIAGYSLKFEVYVAKGWSAGEIWVMMGDWYGWHNYMARYAPWSTASSGNFHPSGWVTATIPLTQFVTVSGAGTSVMQGGKVNTPNNDVNEWDYQTFPTGGTPATKFSDYASTALCFTIVNDQASPSVAANSLNIAIDNVRIVKGQ